MNMIICLYLIKSKDKHGPTFGDRRRWDCLRLCFSDHWGGRSRRVSRSLSAYIYIYTVGAERWDWDVQGWTFLSAQTSVTPNTERVLWEWYDCPYVILRLLHWRVLPQTSSVASWDARAHPSSEYLTTKQETSCNSDPCGLLFPAQALCLVRA